MITQPDSLTLEKEIEAELFSGSIPSWLSDQSNGGTVTATGAATDGGYLEFATGTTAGNSAKLVSAFGIDPDAFDVLECELLMELRTSNGGASVGFKASGSNFFKYNQAANKADVERNGSRTTLDVRGLAGSRVPHRFVLQWDNVDNESRLYSDGYRDGYAGVVPDESTTTNLDLEAYYSGGEGIFRVYDLAVRFYSKR